MANVGVIATYPLFHGFFPNGDPLIGGKLFTYQAGTSTPVVAYHDAAATQPHQNPIVLDDRGEALIHITQAMLWRLETATGVQLWEVDNILGSGGGAGGGAGEIPPSTVGVDHPDVSIGLIVPLGGVMSRLFYNVMQDNVGNLLFDVSGTMRLAGSGTLATIYGDEALTVILPNPMTNHPSFGSFKCFLGAGDYDFYMAKSGYTFETLTGVQGHGTMAQQDASAVAITGGSIVGLTGLGVGTVDLGGQLLNVDGGTSYFGQPVGIRRAPTATITLSLSYPRPTSQGIMIVPSDDTGPGNALLFANAAVGAVGSITTTATATAFNTSSDVRLKSAITPLTGALGVVQALRPVAFRWNADGSAGRGFIASEVQEWAPEAVSGEPDAVNDAGDIVPQGLDMSKLVPYLVGAVQMLAEQVQALTARLEAAGA